MVSFYNYPQIFLVVPSQLFYQLYCIHLHHQKPLNKNIFFHHQKIVLPREIERDPDLLLVGQPTRGVDIGAIEFIHQQIVALRDRGKAILLISVELDEILSLSDKIAVMFDGKIMGESLPSETNEKELGLLMAGVAEQAVQ